MKYNKEINRLLQKGWSLEKIVEYYKANGFDDEFIQQIKEYLNEPRRSQKPS